MAYRFHCGPYKSGGYYYVFDLAEGRIVGWKSAHPTSAWEKILPDDAPLAADDYDRFVSEMGRDGVIEFWYTAPGGDFGRARFDTRDDTWRTE